MTSESVESLYDLIDYLFDKMNIQVEMTENQIVNFASNLSRKVITWTIIENALAIIICLIGLIILMVITIKILKEYSFKKIKLGFEKDDSVYKFSKSLKYSIILGISIIVQILLIINIAICTFQLIQCSLFPEKIVLDFIKGYL